MNKLKQKWGITSNVQFAIIIVVFAITGSTSAYITRPILAWLGITKETMNPWLYWPLSIILILPVYKVLLILIGTIFGQHRFFYDFVKKMLFRMGFGFIYGNRKP